MAPYDAFDCRAQILANLKVLYPLKHVDIITLRNVHDPTDGFSQSSIVYQAIAVEICNITGISSTLLLGGPESTNRKSAFSSLLKECEEALGSMIKGRGLSLPLKDVGVSINRPLPEQHVMLQHDVDSESGESDDFQLVDTPRGSVSADIQMDDVNGALNAADSKTSRVKSEEMAMGLKYDYPPGSGDEWAYWASAHLKMTKAQRPSTKVPAQRRDYPPGSGDEWAYWAAQSKQAKKRGCPQGSNDEWAFWVAEHYKKKASMNFTLDKATKKTERPETSARGSDDEEACQNPRDNVEEALCTKSTVLTDIRDYPPGSGDLWAHFDALHRSKEYQARVAAKRRRDGSPKGRGTDPGDIEKKSNLAGDVRMPKPSVSTYALWLKGLNVE